MVAKRFAIITTLSRGIPAIEDALDRQGVRSRCVGDRAAGHPGRRAGQPATRTRPRRSSRPAGALVADRGAEALILACGGMADVAARSARRSACRCATASPSARARVLAVELRASDEQGRGVRLARADRTTSGCTGSADRAAADLPRVRRPARCCAGRRSTTRRAARDDVLIEVHACGVNHSDLDSRAGTSRWPFAMPWVLGAEFAGHGRPGRRRRSRASRSATR